MTEERASRGADTGPATPAGAETAGAAGTIAGAVGIAQIVARNAVPVIGVLFLHWSASNVLILYLLDTMLSMAVLFAALAKAFSPPADGLAARVRQEFTFVFSALFLCAFIAIPLGLPVALSLVVSDFSLAFAMADHSLRFGLLVQCALALWSYVALRRALSTHSPSELRVKQRFGLVLMSWVVVLLVSYLGFGHLGFGRLLGEVWLLVLVVVYVGASIFAELAPERFLRGTPGDFADDGAARGGRSSRLPAASQLAAASDRKRRP